MPIRPGHALYGVAIRNAAGLWLCLRIHRNPRGEVFVALNTAHQLDNGTRMDLHASYHLDGRYHLKVFRQTDRREQRQPLNTFTGTFTMWGLSVTAPMRFIEPCDPAKLDDVWEIPARLLSQDARIGSTVIEVDLAQPGQLPPLGQRRTLLDRKEYKKSCTLDCRLSLSA